MVVSFCLNLWTRTHLFATSYPRIPPAPSRMSVAVRTFRIFRSSLLAPSSFPPDVIRLGGSCLISPSLLVQSSRLYPRALPSPVPFIPRHTCRALPLPGNLPDERSGPDFPDFPAHLSAPSSFPPDVIRPGCCLISPLSWSSPRGCFREPFLLLFRLSLGIHAEPCPCRATSRMSVAVWNFRIIWFPFSLPSPPLVRVKSSARSDCRWPSVELPPGGV